MIPARVLLTGVMLVVAAQAGVAAACSVRGGYRPPTALDLAVRADTIVIATVDGARPGPDGDIGSVLAMPGTLLKGRVLPPRIVLRDTVLTTDRRMVFRSDPRQLREPNDGALMGGCVRYAFARGMKLVLFLERDATGALVPIRATFARDAEDVTGPNALWVKAVREYAEIANLPADARPDALRRRIVALRAKGGADARAIAADMETELRTPRRPAGD